MHHVGQDLPGLGGNGAVQPVAGCRIDRRHAGNKNEVARSDGRRERKLRAPQSVACRAVGLDDLPEETCLRIVASRRSAAAVTSSMTLSPASICTLITVRAGGAFGTY